MAGWKAFRSKLRAAVEFDGTVSLGLHVLDAFAATWLAPYRLPLQFAAGIVGAGSLGWCAVYAWRTSRGSWTREPTAERFQRYGGYAACALLVGLAAGWGADPTAPVAATVVVGGLVGAVLVWTLQRLAIDPAAVHTKVEVRIVLPIGAALLAGGVVIGVLVDGAAEPSQPLAVDKTGQVIQYEPIDMPELGARPPTRDGGCVFPIGIGAGAASSVMQREQSYYKRWVKCGFTAAKAVPGHGFVQFADGGRLVVADEADRGQVVQPEVAKAWHDYDQTFDLTILGGTPEFWLQTCGGGDVVTIEDDPSEVVGAFLRSTIYARGTNHTTPLVLDEQGFSAWIADVLDRGWHWPVHVSPIDGTDGVTEIELSDGTVLRADSSTPRRSIGRDDLTDLCPPPPPSKHQPATPVTSAPWATTPTTAPTPTTVATLTTSTTSTTAPTTTVPIADGELLP
jgi:hypothetical protein